MPKLKASHYDYIIFDMPPVSQTSVTPRLAGFMDMVLLVIESEKTNQDVVKRANALLAESKANVRAVLNKTHTYVPTSFTAGASERCLKIVSALWHRKPFRIRKSRRPARRVCMLAYSFYESDNRIMRYARALVERGDEVDVIALASDEKQAGF